MVTAVSSSHGSCSLLSTPCCSSSSIDHLKIRSENVSASADAFSRLSAPYFYLGLNMPFNYQVSSMHNSSSPISRSLLLGGLPPFLSVFQNAASLSAYANISSAASFPLTSPTAFGQPCVLYDPAALVGSAVSQPLAASQQQFPVSSLKSIRVLVFDPIRSLSSDGAVPHCLLQSIPVQRYIDEKGNLYEYVVDDTESFDLFTSTQVATSSAKLKAKVVAPKIAEEKAKNSQQLSTSGGSACGKRRSEEIIQNIDFVEKKGTTSCYLSSSNASVKRLCAEVSTPREMTTNNSLQKKASFFEENGSSSEAKSPKSKSRLSKRNCEKAPNTNSTNRLCNGVYQADMKKRGNPGSGYPGVSWNSRMQAWLAFYMDVDGTRRSHTFKCAKCGGVESARIQAVNWLSMKRIEIKSAQAHVLLDEMKRHSTL